MQELLTYEEPLRKDQLPAVLENGEQPPTRSTGVQKDLDSLASEAEKILAGGSSGTEADALFAPIARYFEDWLETLSLQRYAPGVRARMLIGHSIVDPVIPFTESMSLARCLAPETRPCVAIIGLFAHVDLNLNWRSLKSLVCDVMPDLRRLWGLIYRVIRA